MVDRYRQSLYASSTHVGFAELGTVETDASGGYGRFRPEPCRGYAILKLLLEHDFETVLDVGAGALQHARIMIEAGRTVDTVDFGKSDYYEQNVGSDGVRTSHIGDFNNIDFDVEYDAVWCSHILEHQLNPNLFLKKVHAATREGGLVAIVVPPRKPFIVDGHVSLWNAGLVIYHLVLAGWDLTPRCSNSCLLKSFTDNAIVDKSTLPSDRRSKLRRYLSEQPRFTGFDCSEYCRIQQYDYNIGVIVRKRSIAPDLWPADLCMDTGDLERLKNFFPTSLGMAKGFNGDIMSFPPRAEPALKIAILVPSRYGSTRLPGKALVPLNGIPLAKLVFDKCLATGMDVYLLSDDMRVCSLVDNSMMTSENCANGTERCAEAAEQLPQYDAFINVQGDMPDITTEIIRTVADGLRKHDLVSVYTAMSEKERSDPSAVKLIHSQGKAIWSCRAPLSYGDHHLGIYGYRQSTLKRYKRLPRTRAEDDEVLEQLRWFSAGVPMHIIEVDFDGFEINTPEDLAKWNARENGKNQC